MRETEFREHLQKRDMPVAEIDAHIRALQTFEDALRQYGANAASADTETLRCFVRKLADTDSNAIETVYRVCRYLHFIGLRKQYVALLEIVDCHNGIDVLMDAVEKEHGAEIRAQIFREPPPPLGAEEAERFAYTKLISERMNALLPQSDVRRAWFQVQHGITPDEWRGGDEAEREKYGTIQTVTEFLRRKREDRNEMLKTLHDQHRLWFTMDITDEVLEFLTDDVHMTLGEHGGRQGIVISKVPYQPAKVLHETDSVLKRYYSCHCPMIREAILRGEPIPPEVCYCSLGHASHFLAGIGLDGLEGEVLQSAAQGDERCRFIFYLPETAARA